MQSVATIATPCLFLLSNNLRTAFKSYFNTLIGVSFFGIFIICFISIINSSNLHEFGNIIISKTAFLFIPLSLICVNSLEKKQLKLIQYIFIVCCLISSFWSYFYYIQNIELYTRLYAQGEVIPTLIHHISFAVLLCITVLFILNNLLAENSKPEKIINLILLVWFIYFIHILSVRTGIVLLYISIILFGISSLFIYKKPVFAIGLMLFLLCCAFIYYAKIPTLRSKIDYSLYGLYTYKHHNDTTNIVSDTRRILSDKIGIELIKNNKLAGVGIGDIQDEMNIIYKQRYPKFKSDVYSHIHNQYLYTICGVGIISGAIFCLLLLLPFVQFIMEKKFLFSIIYIHLLLVMFWEAFIQSQLGASIFLVVCCLGFVSEKES